MTLVSGARVEPRLTDTLCTRCGLCCDGSLLADVELSGRAEATRMEILGLRIDDDEDRALMVLPCAALHGTRCDVYAHRPRCCRTFECGLLQDARRGAVTVERALGLIAETHAGLGRVKLLLAQLGHGGSTLPLAERVAEVLATEARSSVVASRRRAELEAAMAAVERTIRKYFLGDPTRGQPRS